MNDKPTSSRFNISGARMQELSDQAAWYADSYCPAPHAVLPQVIAEEQGLFFSLNDYGGYFDGLLECRKRQFHVFLHTNEGDHLYSPRLRFSFAHELGHFLIDSHRNALLNPAIPSHGSVASLESALLVEREADMFAACLLMPEDRLRQDIFRKKFCFTLIDELSKKYMVSLTAVMLRFIALGNHPIMLACSKAGKLKWLRYSEDFPFKSLNLGPCFQIPECSCAGEYFSDGTKYQGKTETVFAEDWFVLSDYQDRRRELNEYCIYQDSLNQVISLIWE